MGSRTFQHSYIGKLTPAEAYSILCEEAVYEYGHDAYSGTIATTSGFVMVNTKGRRAATVVEEILDSDSHAVRKWGPAGCIELKGAAVKKLRDRQPDLKGKRGIRAFIFFGWAAE